MMQETQRATDRMIRLPEVMDITSFSRPQIYKLISKGVFPRQYRLSHKVAAWKESEIRAWVDSVVSA